MKNFTKFFVATSLAVATLFALSSCSEDAGVDGPDDILVGTPVITSVTLQEDTLSDVYAAIDVVYADADAIYYVCYLSSDVAGEYDSVEVAEGSTTATIELNDLVAESEYVAEFYVVNADESSETLSVTFTTAEAVVKETITVENVVAGALMISADVTIDKSVCDGYAIYSNMTEWYNEEYFWYDFPYGYVTYITESGTAQFGADYFLTANTEYTLVFAAYTDNGDGTYSAVGDLITIETATTPLEVGVSDTTAALTIDDSLTTLTGFGATVERNDDICGYYFYYMAASDAPDGVGAWIESTGWLSGYNASAQTFVEYVYDPDTYMSYPQLVDQKSVTAYNLVADTEYIAFTVAVDNSGNLGQITSTTVTTASLAVDPNLKPTVTVTPYETTADFEFDFGDCAKVFHMHAESSNTWTTAETSYAYFLNDLSTMYYGWSVDQAVDGVISHTEEWLSMGIEYNMYYLGVAADGTMGEIQTLTYTTKTPSYDSSATLNVSMTSGQAYYAYGLDYPDYLYALVSYSVEMSNGATSYIYTTTGSLGDGSTAESYGNAVLGSYGRVQTSETELVDVRIDTKGYLFAAVPVDADGAYGTPVYLDFDGWDNPIESEDDGSGDGGGIAPLAIK